MRKTILAVASTATMLFCASALAEPPKGVPPDNGNQGCAVYANPGELIQSMTVKVNSPVAYLDATGFDGNLGEYIDRVCGGGIIKEPPKEVPLEEIVK